MNEIRLFILAKPARTFGTIFTEEKVTNDAILFL
jgi:hypothetical protein